MKNLNELELQECNGGNVPMAWYMDSDTISANSGLVGPSASNFWELIKILV